MIAKRNPNYQKELEQYEIDYKEYRKAYEAYQELRKLEDYKKAAAEEYATYLKLKEKYGN